MRSASAIIVDLVFRSQVSVWNVRIFPPIGLKPVAMEVSVKVLKVSKEVAGYENDSIVIWLYIASSGLCLSDFNRSC